MTLVIDLALGSFLVGLTLEVIQIAVLHSPNGAVLYYEEYE